MRNLKLFKQKVLVTGANGLLGQKVVTTLLDDFELRGLGQEEKSSLDLKKFHYTPCDITARAELHELIRMFEPTFIINCAAFTNVDDCEDDKEQCWKVNVIGVENIAEIARRIGAFVVHISTDYVFDGTDGNYHEESRPKPLGYYGRSKLASENALISSGVEHAIARTMVLYGTGKYLRHNFVTWLIEKLRKGEIVKIVEDQFGHPTLVNDLALAIRKIIELKKTGVFHITGSECVNRYELALKVAKVFKLNSDLIYPIKTKDLNQKAPRPLNSSFDLSKCRSELGIEMSDVETGLAILKQQLRSSKSLFS